MTAGVECCGCGSGLSYDLCCGPYHAGALPPTAEALMRSRYCAFVLRIEAYLLGSWAPETRPPAIDFGDPCVWLGLTIKRAYAISPDDAFVEFVARYKVDGKAVRLHELSRFNRRDGRWLYVDGAFPSARAAER